jgi:hypothetical protein
MNLETPEYKAAESQNMVTDVYVFGIRLVSTKLLQYIEYTKCSHIREY